MARAALERWLSVNRKGQTISYEMLMWIPRFVYLVIVILATSGLILGFIVTKVDVSDVESHILLHRLQFSHEGIARYDSYTGRVYPGLVDVGRLTSGNLKSSLGAKVDEMAARFVLSDFSDNELAKAYLNEEAYANWQPIAIVVGGDSEISGTGRKFPHPEARYVYAATPEGAERKRAVLETVVITPND